MHTLRPLVNSDKYEVIFISGTASYPLLITRVAIPLIDAVQLVNYLNGGSAAASPMVLTDKMQGK